MNSKRLRRTLLGMTPIPRTRKVEVKRELKVKVDFPMALGATDKQVYRWICDEATQLALEKLGIRKYTRIAFDTDRVKVYEDPRQPKVRVAGTVDITIYFKKAE